MIVKYFNISLEDFIFRRQGMNRVECELCGFLSTIKNKLDNRKDKKLLSTNNYFQFMITLYASSVINSSTSLDFLESLIPAFKKILTTIEREEIIDNLELEYKSG